MKGRVYGLGRLGFRVWALGFRACRTIEGGGGGGAFLDRGLGPPI